MSTPLRAPPTAIATASAPCYITSGNGGCTALLIPLLIFAITLFFILWRPRGIREAWFAAGGAALMGAAGFVGWSDVVRLWAETGDVLAFLAGMLVVGYVADQAGVFSWLAYHTARLSRGSGVRLYVGLYLIGVFVTVWFSLDTTAVVLAPIVYSLVQALGLPPLPFVLATTYVANTASLLLPVSNLTNLIVWSRFDVPFWRYAAVMALPAAAAVAVNLGLFLWMFRRDIPARFSPAGLGGAPAGRGEEAAPRIEAAAAGGAGEAVRDTPVPAPVPAPAPAPAVAVAAVLEAPAAAETAAATAGATIAGSGSASVLEAPMAVGADSARRHGADPAPGRESPRLARSLGLLAGILLGLAAAPFFGWEIWVVAVAGGAVLAGIELAAGGLRPRQLATGISWDLLPFVFSLFLVLRGVGNSGLTEPVRALLTGGGTGDSFGELLTVAAATALGSNLINNLPMLLVAADSLAEPVLSGQVGMGVLYAALLGTNLGPNLTVIGSLATMLSLSIIGKKGLRVSGVLYLKVGLVTVPLLLAASVLGLWLTLKLF